MIQQGEGRKWLAELVGTFMLLFAGTGAIISNQVSGGSVTHVGVALTFGLVILISIYAFGDISGAHFNPAVTLGFWFARRFPASSIPGYVIAQGIGALLASFSLKMIFSGSSTLGVTQPAGSPMQSFVLEAIMTFMLMLVILRVSEGAKEKGITAGIAIGGTIAVDALFGGPISGASMNPIRSLAPALVAGNFAHLWIYLIAPVLGAAAAVFASRGMSEQPVR